jgi:hypothetical protein
MLVQKHVLCCHYFQAIKFDYECEVLINLNLIKKFLHCGDLSGLMRHHTSHSRCLPLSSFLNNLTFLILSFSTKLNRDLSPITIYFSPPTLNLKTFHLHNYSPWLFAFVNSTSLDPLRFKCININITNLK